MAIADKVTIEIDGKELKNFVSFKIFQSIDTHHQFDILFHKDALEQPDNEPLVSTIGYIGCTLTISIEGIDSDNAQRLFFKGIITSIHTTEATGSGMITITGNGVDILLNDVPRCRSFENKTLKQILDDVLQTYPKDVVKSKVSPINTDQYPFIVQYKENNYSFLHRLATRYGEWFYFDGHDLIFGSPGKDKKNLVLGLDLLNFELSLQMNPMKFKYVFYDYMEKTSLVAKSSASDPTSNLNSYGKSLYNESLKKYQDESVFYYGNLNTDETGFNNELTRVVDTENKARAIAMTMANGASSALLKLGDSVKIKARKSDNSGDIAYGEYLITTVSHHCDSAMNYQNYFVGIPSDAQIPGHTNPNATPRAETQSAVVKDRNDPKNLGRVRVKFLWQDDNQMTPWLRITTLIAGKGRGFFAVPELEDEVIVDFEGGDAEHPFILGSVYNGKATPHPDGKDFKDAKYLISQKGSEILIDEREGWDRILIINGVGDEGNSIELNFKEKKLSIVSTGDIVLAAKNIHINAKENIFMNAEQKMTLGTDSDDLTIKSGKGAKISGKGGVSVSGDTQIQGGNVTIKGDAKVSVEGASVSVNGSGTTEIKGGVVKIN